MQQLVKPEIPTTLMEKMKKLPELMKLGSFPPKTVRSGICQQVVLEGEAADLTRLPIIQCWPLDGNLDSGQVFDPQRRRGRAGADGAIHHLCRDLHAQPRDRRSQYRDVPRAAFRPAAVRDALAHAS